jgi:kynureninase
MSIHINGVKPVFPGNAATKEYAASLDAADPLAAFRDKFIIPSKANIASKKLAKPSTYHGRIVWVITR